MPNINDCLPIPNRRVCSRGFEGARVRGGKLYFVDERTGELSMLRPQDEVDVLQRCQRSFTPIVYRHTARPATRSSITVTARATS